MKHLILTALLVFIANASSGQSLEADAYEAESYTRLKLYVQDLPPGHPVRERFEARERSMRSKAEAREKREKFDLDLKLTNRECEGKPDHEVVVWTDDDGAPLKASCLARSTVSEFDQFMKDTEAAAPAAAKPGAP